MTKDYAKRRRTQYSNVKRQSNSVTIFPAWGWMSIGLLLGICCTILYWQLQHLKPATKTIVDIQVPPKTPPQTKLAKTNSKVHTKKPHTDTTRLSSRFDFYTVLPNMNQAQTFEQNTSPLELALQPLASDKEKASTLTEDKPNIAVETETSYVIQAGSFHRQEQADALKAQLALLGFEASIQTFKMGNRDTRYRVLIGPFTSKDHAYLQQRQLEQAQHVHSVVLKIKV